MSLVFPVLGFLLGLNPYAVLEIMLISVFLFFYKRKTDVRHRQEMDKLEECSFYLSQLLDSFMRCHKIDAALQDLLKMTEGNLWCVVKKAENRIQLAWQDEDCYETALQIPEQYYHCFLMGKVHWFLIRVESEGGECTLALRYLKHCVKDWKTWCMDREKQVENVKNKLNFCLVLSGVIWLFLAKLAPAEVDIRDNMLFQFFMLAGVNALALTYFCFLKIGKKHGEKVYDRTEYEKMWKKIYGSKKGFSYARVKKILDQKVKENFSFWMMEMLLRLQTQSVTAAIEQSIVGCPDVLYVPLQKLNEELKSDFVSAAPYNRFLKELGLAEVKNMMSGLYAMRSMGEEEIQYQILELLERNNQLHNSVQKMKLEEYVGMTGMLAAVPMGISVLVMLGNMTLIMTTFLQQFSGSLQL